LYYLRWGVEIEYDVLKNTLEIENFSGRTETAIRQDFHIHIIASNMLAASFWEAQETVDREHNDDNVVNSVLKMTVFSV
jgi:IS4 transposase